MALTLDDTRPQGNRLLAALPRAEYERLLPHLEVAPLEFRAVLYEKDRPIEHIYFPLGGVISMITIMDDGSIIEVATVGNEGMIGLPVFLGATSSPLETFAQIPGSAARLPARTFRELVTHDGRLHELLHRYTQALFILTAQSVACNRHHPINERCARWLLMTHDRVDADQFPLTHEFLGQMLGVRRASVTVAAGILQQAGLIDYQRGIITIRDRAGLEEASCECYRIIRDEFDKMLG